MPWRTLLELLHIAVGVLVVRLIASLAAWSVPNARVSIWWVAYVFTALVVVMGIRPIVRAWARDRGAAKPSDKNDAPDA